MPTNVSAELAALGQTSVADTGFATDTDDITALANGEKFTGTAFLQTEQFPDFWTVEDTDFEVTFIDNDTVDMTINGRTFQLSRIANSNLDEFGTTLFDETITLRVSRAAGTDATIFDGTIDQFDPSNNILQRQVAYGTIGYATDPATLAMIAQAQYEGSASLSFRGGSDNFNSTDGTASLSADFAAGTLTGDIVYTPGANGSVPQVTAAVDGSMSGNAFEANVDITAVDLGTVRADPVVLRGQIFGSGGETLMGTANGVAATGQSGAFNDRSYLLQVDATKQ